MVDVSKVRELIRQGLSDAEIEYELRREEWDGDWQKPANFLQALSSTMRLAVECARAVDLREVQSMAVQLRRMWEQAYPGRDRDSIEKNVLAILSRSGQPFADETFAHALVDMENDLQVLATPATTHKRGSLREKERTEAVRRYSDAVDGHEFINVSSLGRAIADCMKFIEGSFRSDRADPVVDSIPGELLQLIVVHRPQWRELVVGQPASEEESAPAPR